MLENPSFWVAVAFVTFFVMFGKKMGVALLNLLDARTSRIRVELEEARRLREEAEGALAAYKRQHTESLKEAEAIIVQARKEAEIMAQSAQAELKALLKARTEAAHAKIAQAEKQAIEDVKNHVIDITIAAAKALIEDNIRQLPGDELTRAALADIERKLH